MTSRDDFDRAMSVTAKAIHAWDPYRLIEGGAPEEEFDAEIGRLLTWIPRIASADDAARAVSYVFTESFGEGFAIDTCAEVGERWFAALVDAGLANLQA